MINLVVPVAGAGRRFLEEGYKLPKQLITVGTKTNIEWSMSSIERSEDTRTIFIMRKDQQLNDSLDEILKDKFGEDCKIVVVPELTSGAAITTLYAEEAVANLDDPWIIFTPDVYFEPHLKISHKLFENSDGNILVTKANSKNYSYVELDNDGYVKRTAEKQVISPYAAVGVYIFSSGRRFKQAVENMVKDKATVNNEYYLCPVYNYLSYTAKVKVTHIEKLHIFGTPEEMRFFVNNSMKTFPEYKRCKPVALCADHSGYEAKEFAKQALDSMEIPYIDFGTFSPKDCDYTTFVQEAANSVKYNICSFGIGFCRTGQGVNITANKVPGIRSALVFDEYTATKAIRHNCANFFSVASKYALPDIHTIIKAWQDNTFDGGRHQNRLQELE